VQELVRRGSGTGGNGAVALVDDGDRACVGVERAKILPPGLRTRTLCTRLPRYLIDMLQHQAAAERASLELFLSRELQDLASAQRETLARELPGFGESFDWPRRNETHPNY